VVKKLSGLCGKTDSATAELILDVVKKHLCLLSVKPLFLWGKNTTEIDSENCRFQRISKRYLHHEKVQHAKVD
jgi:hypothetical protein